MAHTTEIEAYLRGLQDRLCDALAQADGAAGFAEDSWQRAEGGGGRSRVLKNGALFEQAGVNLSVVHGQSLPKSATAHRPELEGRAWSAMGVSLVLHPHNPHVPTTHMNVRYFEARREGAEDIWWFGGGFDLTPYYPVDEDVVHWHSVARDAVAPFGAEVLEQDFEAVLTDNTPPEVAETALNLTNHSYFQLSDGPTIEGTDITLCTSQFLQVDEFGLPTGASNIAAYPGITPNTPFTPVSLVQRLTKGRSRKGRTTTPAVVVRPLLGRQLACQWSMEA